MRSLPRTSLNVGEFVASDMTDWGDENAIKEDVDNITTNETRNAISKSQDTRPVAAYLMDDS